MTLTVRTRPPARHKKISGQHHRRGKDYHKAYWPYLPIIAVVVAGFVLNSAWPNRHSVLGYATDMSIQNLLADTNAQRTGNSQLALGLNAELDQAAQAKANDMAARNYWSHDTPDGQTPWSFITAAGYSYQAAGENLAYGFSTAGDTLTGWMNSPEHRANILNANYQEVGFGIANSPNYQNSGPETIVVAMYAKPTGAVVAATVPSTPAASAPIPTTTVSGRAAASTQAGAPAPAPQATNTAEQPVNTPNAAKNVAKPVPEIAPQNISRVQLLTAGKAPWSMFAVSLIVSAALLAFLLRHGFAWHKVLVRGERFVLSHPLLDVAFVGLIMVGFILTRAAGVIR